MILTFQKVAKRSKRVRDTSGNGCQDRGGENRELRELWHRGKHTSVNRIGEHRQSILIRVRQSGDQSQRWRRCGAREALTQAVLKIGRHHSHGPLRFAFLMFIVSLCLSSSSLSLVPDCIESSSHPLSLPISLFPFWLLSVASSPCPHHLPHSSYISVWYPQSVIRCLPPTTPPTHFPSLNPIQGVLLAS